MRRTNKSVVLGVVIALALLNTACPASKQLTSAQGIDRVENKLNQAANALNALAKTNRTLYQQNVINLADRQRVAGIIGRANARLDQIVDRVFAIDPNNPDSIDLGKVDVVKLLNAISNQLNTINFGPPELRLAAQAVIGIINEAIDLTNRVRAVRAIPSPTPNASPEVNDGQH